MATILSNRVVRVVRMADEFGCEGDVAVTLKGSGIELRGKGTNRRLSLTWRQLAAAADYPPAAPSRFLANPLGWLVERSRQRCRAK